MCLEDLIPSESGVNSIPRDGTAGIGCCSGLYPRLLSPNVHLTSQVKTLGFIIQWDEYPTCHSLESWSLTDGHIYLVWLNLSHAHMQAV